MGKAHNPRRGSMQFWPRKRARRLLPAVRSWSTDTKVKPLAFVGFKVGMTHLMIDDTRAKSATKGQKLAVPSTIIECPPLLIAGVVFYKETARGLIKSSSFLQQKLPKELVRSIQLPKKQTNSWDDSLAFDDLRLLVVTQNHLLSVPGKKPQLLEMALGGSKEEKAAFAKDNLGKELNVADTFAPGVLVDVRGVTKGKGFQGTVKRFGVPIRQKKSEKTKRGIGNLGAWTPKRVDFRVPQPGKMGYHLRTDYNKLVLAAGTDASSIMPAGGFHKYGLVKNPYLLVKGSVMGPRKRAVMLLPAQRPNKKIKGEPIAKSLA